MQVASLGWATDLMVRQLEGSSVLDKDDHIVVRTPANPAYYWGNFVLAGADHADHERWLGVFPREFPGARHVAIGLDGAAVPDEALAGYRAAGLDVDIEQVLVATRLDAPPALPHADCRPLADDDDWVQALELDLACAERTDEQHLVFLRRRADQRRELCSDPRAVWFGAFTDGRLRASLGLVSDGQGLARYQHVQTHPRFRRRGLARTLVAFAGRYGLGDLGARSLVIIADLGYHAVSLYRSLGFADAETQVSLLKTPQT